MSGGGAGGVHARVVIASSEGDIRRECLEWMGKQERRPVDGGSGESGIDEDIWCFK